jgi:low temperature requirement protein LtrA
LRRRQRRPATARGLAWSFTTWTTSWFDAHTVTIRFLLVGVMLGSLFMSAAIPDSFGASGLAFVLPYVAIQVGRNAWTLFAIGSGHPLTQNFLRVLLWSIALGVPWLAGGFVEGDARFALWALAVVVDYIVTWVGFPVPRLGRSRTPDWMIAGGHLAERYELFIILALGESILVTGATYGELPRSMATIAALVVAFAGSLTLWWLYFDRGAEVGRAAITHTVHPGRLALSAYSYYHLPMVAGIILAAGADEAMIAHPTEPVSPATIVLILGGPVLYLIGNALFNWVLFGVVPWSRLAAIAALLTLWPLAAGATTLSLLIAATLILVAVAVWDLRQGMRAVRAVGAVCAPDSA